ncbi:MAG TPA: ABC transporter ATP-binding protein, partial [Usitatibacter sp.]|nr:ABC transporter ATP-binding protein [Usitatibacter sp.]
LRRFMAEAEGRRSLARGDRELACDRGEVRIESLEVAGALHGVSAVARPRERVAIVGPHGAGKSTLLAVVARLLDPEAGTVRIDGIDVLRCRLASVRAAVGLVGPDLPLMRGTVEHNLRYRRPCASDEEVQRVARLAGLEPLAASREGLAARVTSGGTNLSAGERQRIALARALLGDPCILLLDDAEAHLDATSAAALDRVVASFPGTVLMVTHDLARARRADAVWHLERGRLVAEGPPAQLLRPGEPACEALRAHSLRAVA